MANLSRANSRSGTLSTIHRFQHSNQKLKQWILPPLHRTVSHSKSKMKSSVKPSKAAMLSTSQLKPSKSAMLSRSQLKPSKIAMLSTSQLMTLSETQGREQLHTGMIQARLRLMRSMVRSQRASLKELCNHEAFLSKLNQDLVKTIQDMEDATALNVRALLQQQHVLGTVIGILEYSNKKRVQELSSELQEWEEKEEHKMSSLEQEVQRLNDEISATHEEVNFLSTYMDHEYPVKSVQIADHMRQLQQAKDQQQDELDNLNEMRKMILDSLCNVIREKQKEMLKSLMTKIQQPFEKRLQHKTLNSQNMQRHMAFLKDFIEEMKKEISILADEVKEPESQVLDPREIVFEDVLLRRPRCSPDMAVTLNIPMEDLLF